MPGLDSIAAADDIRIARPQARIGILTRHNHLDLYNRARKARLNGFILKQDSMEELNYAIKTMLRGGFYTPPSFSSAFMDPSVDPDPVEHLTVREKSAFALYAQGYVVKDIANTLHVSMKTAETHLNNLRRKLGHTQAASLAGSRLRPILISVGALLDRAASQE